MKKQGLLGLEMELLLLNKELYPISAYRKVRRLIPPVERGIRGSKVGLTRMVKELYPSIIEINFRPYWDDEFDYFTTELQTCLSRIWKKSSEKGIYPAPIAAPLIVSGKQSLRPGETCAMHFHYSWGGGFLRREERLPYYNVFCMLYLVLLPATMSSGYIAGKRRSFLGGRYKIATALYPPVHIREDTFDFDSILDEMEKLSSEFGIHHAYPCNPRLLDIAPLTKEEAYFLLSRKSTVEIRAFDTVPSLLIIRALWILIAAIGRFISDHEEAFRDVDRTIFRSIWLMRNRVLKKGFNATTIPVSKGLLPKIGDEYWPRFLYENMTIKDALLWLIEYIGEYIDQLAETSQNIKHVIDRFKTFVSRGLTPSERILEIINQPNWKKRMLEIFEWAIYDIDFVP